MPIMEAFLSAKADDLFSSVAAFGDAKELEALDVVHEGQQKARRAIETAISNAAHRRKTFGSRIALIKGDAGSGKSHVLTTAFTRAVAMTAGAVCPAVLQLTAPVRKEDYAAWLIDATIRQLTARHFADDENHSPLRRLAGQLLSRMPYDEQDEFVRLIDDLNDNSEIHLALKFGRRIRKEAQTLLIEDPPREAFLAVLLLAGFGDSSATHYLRQGVIDRRMQILELDELKTAHQRVMILQNLGLTAQIVGASLVLGFDQVENAVRLGGEDLFTHALTQAVRIAEDIVNCAVVVAVLRHEYEDIVLGRRNAQGLAISDIDRIEHVPPFPVTLDRGTPDFHKKVIAHRLGVLRKRTNLPDASDCLDPLPEWFASRVGNADSMRLALRQVGRLREKALELGRMPSRQEYAGSELEEQSVPTSPVEEIDFDKMWADFQDVAPRTRNKLLDTTKADLLAWWAKEASRENLAGEPAEVSSSTLDDAFSTPVIDILIKANSVALERRQLALCEAPNRNQKLADQIERFLEFSSGIPAILRTNGFPKGRQTQVAGSLRKIEALGGLKLDLGDTEWHTLQRAKDFADLHAATAGFLAWRRDRQWLLRLMAPLQPLIAYPEVIGEVSVVPEPSSGALSKSQPTAAPGAGTQSLTSAEASRPDTPVRERPFPVLIGPARDGTEVFWDPYRTAPNHLNNFSFLVTGDSGSGKTETIRVFIDAACREGLALSIFDFKIDYSKPEFAQPLGIEIVDVRAQGLPFNPLQPPPRGASGVQPIEHAYELASVLARIFRLGGVQEGLLRDAIAGAYRDAAIEPRDWIDPSGVSWPSFDHVLARLHGVKGAASLVTKLSVLCELGLFPAAVDPQQSFESFLAKRVCLKLNDLPTDEVKSALAEIIIIQLHGYALRGDQPRRLKRMMIFDEAHRVKDSRRLESLAREGRAFGVGIVVGTQFPGDIPDTMAGNLATQLFLMNKQANHRKFVVRQMHGTTTGPEPKKLLENLSALRPYQGLFVNAHHNGVLLEVVPHHARRSKQ